MPDTKSASVYAVIPCIGIAYWNKPDVPCRISHIRRDEVANRSHDGDGPEGQSIAAGKDLIASQSNRYESYNNLNAFTEETIQVFRVTTGSTESLTAAEGKPGVAGESVATTASFSESTAIMQLNNNNKE